MIYAKLQIMVLSNKKTIQKKTYRTDFELERTSIHHLEILEIQL